MPKKTKGLGKIGCMVTIFLLFTCTTYAQNAVTGKVINKADNSPVPGATITVRGTKVISQSGADGTFSINLPGSKATLVISAIGFGNLELPVTAGTPAGNIAMTTISTTLNDVIVTGYTSQRKGDI